MKTTLTVFIFSIFIQFNLYGQFSRKKIETDSSNIEIVKNSLYKIYKETYKHKDLEWYSVHYIKDTTRLNTEGWSKNGKYIGVWKEYTYDGVLMFTRDYDNATCKMNKSMYPYHNTLEQMKRKADDLIIKTYSKEFLDEHVRFDFNCYVYDEDGNYIGTWTEPIEKKPANFLFRYQVKLNTSEWYDEMIGIELDKNGEFIPSKGFFNNYGFEKVEPESRTFKIDKNRAIEIAKTKGLNNNNIDKVSEFLFWERFKKPEFYNGKFKYYITEFTKEIKDINPEGRSRIVYKYNVYSFNPWTGEFIEKKKMKKIKEWEQNSGYTSGLLPDE